MPREDLLAIARDLDHDPGLGAVAVAALEGADARRLTAAGPLLDLLIAKGSAAAVMRARRLLARIDAIAGVTSADSTEAVEHLLAAHSDGDIGDDTLWDGVHRMWSDRPQGDPLVDASIWLESVATREALHRRAVQEVLDAEPRLAWLTERALPRFFTTPDPRLRVLERLPYELYSAEMTEGAP